MFVDAPALDSREKAEAARVVSRLLAQDNAHRVEQIDGYTQSARCRCGSAHPDHASDLKCDHGSRHEFPGMVERFDRKTERMCEPPDALAREIPQMLRWGHTPPAR